MPPGNTNGTKHLTESERQRIRTLINDGHMTTSEVEKATGYTQSQIRTAKQSATVGKRSGRPVMPENVGKPKRIRDRRKEAQIRADALAAAAQANPPPVIAWKPAVPVVIDRTKTIVLITGSNRGLGLAMVQSLLRTEAAGGEGEGEEAGGRNGGGGGGGGGPYHVFLCSRDPAKGEEAAASLTAEHGNSVSVLQLDVTNDVSIKLAAQRVEKEAGRVDVLVNNAGTLRQTGDPVDVLRDALESNLVSAYAMTEAFKMLLMAQQTGAGSESLPRKEKRLIHVSSDQGSIHRRSDPEDALYHSQLAEWRISKAALNMMTACQRYATKDAGVKVCAWSPGYTATGLGGMDPELSKLQGARDPAAVAEAFVGIVKGERDDDLDKLLHTFEGTIPW